MNFLTKGLKCNLSAQHRNFAQHAQEWVVMGETWNCQERWESQGISGERGTRGGEKNPIYSIIIKALYQTIFLWNQTVHPEVSRKYSWVLSGYLQALKKKKHNYRSNLSLLYESELFILALEEAWKIPRSFWGLIFELKHETVLHFILQQPTIFLVLFIHLRGRVLSSLQFKDFMGYIVSSAW